MNHDNRRPNHPPDPCPAFAEACVSVAWGEGADAPDVAHLEQCPRCQAAVAAMEELATACKPMAAVPPAAVTRGLTEEILSTTTRGRRQSAWQWVPGWAGAAGLVAAGLATLVWWRGPSSAPGPDGMPDFADADLDLLENLDLAQDLELLEILDALEEIDDA